MLRVLARGLFFRAACLGLAQHKPESLDDCHIHNGFRLDLEDLKLGIRTAFVQPAGTRAENGQEGLDPRLICSKLPDMTNCNKEPLQSSCMNKHDQASGDISMMS